MYKKLKILPKSKLCGKRVLEIVGTKMHEKSTKKNLKNPKSKLCGKRALEIVGRKTHKKNTKM